MNRLKQLYFTFMPFMVIYPTLIGIDTGITTNKKNPQAEPFVSYSNVIGYTTVGIVTGLTYPISFPFFAYYVLYKQKS